MFAYRTAILDFVNDSPFFLVYGRDPRLPTECWTSPSEQANEISNERLTKANRFVSLSNARISLAKLVNENKEKSLAKFNETRRPSLFWPGDLVVVWRPPRHKKTQTVDSTRKFAFRAIGPFRVIARKEKDAYELEHIFTKNKLISNASKMTQYRPWKETYENFSVPDEEQPSPPTNIYELLNDSDVNPGQDFVNALGSSNTDVLRVKRLSQTAKLPLQKNTGVAGHQLFAAHDFTIAAGVQTLIPTDITIQIPNGFYGRIVPTNGTAYMQSLQVQNEIIDPDFRGNIGIVLRNSSSKPVVINQHDKIAQLILGQTKILPIVETNWLSDMVNS